MNGQASVLVVDDNLDLLDTFSLILQRKGYQVDTAADGLLAIDKLQKQSFDLILMDVIMPRMDGVEALHRVRELDPGVKVIMMTAYSDEEQVRKAVRDGAYCTLSKPVRIARLMELIGEALSGPLILVVDDDDDFCSTLVKTLQLKGYTAKAARSGEEALDISRAKKCQIALVDIKMPRMNGLETYLKLREINSSLEAIMMTGYGAEMGEMVDRAMLNSAVTCLYKPFDPAQVLALVSKLGNRQNNGGKDGGQTQHTAG